MMKTALAIFPGGGAGSLLRYAISRTVIAFGPAGAFPWATWITNLLATGLLAWLVWRVGVGQPGASCGTPCWWWASAAASAP